jgi:cbb3-type cytochrome oxidase subunit 1
MEPFVRTFLKASLAWLGLGVTLGVAMAAHPAWAVYRPAHLHMNVLGFVAMMIYGVALHVVPRFSGHALHSRRLAAAQLWLANAGLAGMVVGFALRAHGVPAGTPVLAVGGLLGAAGAYAFIWNVWRTIDGPRALRPAAARAAAAQQRAGGRQLPQAAAP